jgi:Zn finger protein HypA/HybF involved in hydrogenase expression
MKIQLHCPTCHGKLTDQYEADDIRIILSDIEHPLQMECLKCGKYITVNLRAAEG